MVCTGFGVVAAAAAPATTSVKAKMRIASFIFVFPLVDLNVQKVELYSN